MNAETVVKATIIFLIIFAVLCVLDVGTTYAGMQRPGFVEANPVAVAAFGLFGVGPGLVLLGIVSYVIASFLLLKTLKRAMGSESVRHAQISVMALIGLMKVGAVLNNTYLLIRTS